jgi:hypothetical protein
MPEALSFSSLHESIQISLVAEMDIFGQSSWGMAVGLQGYLQLAFIHFNQTYRVG